MAVTFAPLGRSNLWILSQSGQKILRQKMRKEGIEQRFPSLETQCSRSINRDFDRSSIMSVFSCDHVIVGKAHDALWSRHHLVLVKQMQKWRKQAGQNQSVSFPSCHRERWLEPASLKCFPSKIVALYHKCLGLIKPITTVKFNPKMRCCRPNSPTGTFISWAFVSFLHHCGAIFFDCLWRSVMY